MAGFGRIGWPVSAGLGGRFRPDCLHELRSLDAIHLASALSARADLTTFVVYDSRLRLAAAEADIDVESPA